MKAKLPYFDLEALPPIFILQIVDKVDHIAFCRLILANNKIRNAVEKSSRKRHINGKKITINWSQNATDEDRIQNGSSRGLKKQKGYNLHYNELYIRGNDVMSDEETANLEKYASSFMKKVFVKCVTFDQCTIMSAILEQTYANAIFFKTVSNCWQGNAIPDRITKIQGEINLSRALNDSITALTKPSNTLKDIVLTLKFELGLLAKTNLLDSIEFCLETMARLQPKQQILMKIKNIPIVNDDFQINQNSSLFIDSNSTIIFYKGENGVATAMIKDGGAEIIFNTTRN